MTGREFRSEARWCAFFLVAGLVVASFGEPRPFALYAGGAGAASALFIIARAIPRRLDTVIDELTEQLEQLKKGQQ